MHFASKQTPDRSNNKAQPSNRTISKAPSLHSPVLFSASDNNSLESLKLDTIVGVEFLATHTMIFRPALYRYSLTTLCVLLQNAFATASEVTEIRYSRDIRPILSDNCFFCHGTDPETREGDLRLDIREDALKGKAFVPGNPAKSLLVKVINSTDPDVLMPPKKSHKSLSESDKKILTEWIKLGAEYEPHWAYVAPNSTPGGTIDSIVAHDHQREGLAFSEPAAPEVLVRRFYFDLIGLPPTSEQAQNFLTAYAQSPRVATEALVDKLLASPHFGEQMAISWLDNVRYADTVGYHGDKPVSTSPYRDYVIKSFNEDKPYDEFTIEQLAGDLLPNPTLEQKVAAAYNRIAQISEEGGIQDKEYLKKYQAERVRTTSSAWLGSTMACCECHDHKFDPFTAKDFYSFASYFSDILEKGAYNNNGDYQEDFKKWSKNGVEFSKFGPFYRVPNTEQKKKLNVFDQQIINTRQSLAKNNDTAKAKELENLLSKREKFQKSITTTIPATISAKRRTVRVLNRGDWQDNAGEIVAPSPPQFLTGGKRIEHKSRLDLAKWIVNKDNPLTARVFVNRLWQRYFGIAISRNTGDLGLQGEFPSHPELLDHLAVSFMDNDWKIKPLIRKIVLSRTYQQSSTPDSKMLEQDPHNRQLARQSQLRLPAELIRDNALAISGLLNTKVGGPSVRPYQPEGYYRHLNFPRRKYQQSKNDDQYRRGIYTHWQRTFLHPMLKNFGAPSREECTTERPDSNTPLQALNLLNDPSFLEAARVFAEKLLNQGEAQIIERAYLASLSRSPSGREIEVLETFYQQEFERFSKNPQTAKDFINIGATPVATNLEPVKLAATTSLARVLFNLHESITRY